MRRLFALATDAQGHAMTLPLPLQPLTAYPHFIVWQRVPVPGSHRSQKFPVHPQTGARSDAHNRAIWLPAADAMARAQALGPDFGLAFVFSEDDPFFFLDVDNCAVPDAPGQWDSTALWLRGLFKGAAVEVSDSGTGLHIFGTGSAPTPRRCKSSDPSRVFDLYTEGRFVALTLRECTGDASTSHGPALASLTAPGAPLAPTGPEASTDWTDAPVPGWKGHTDDSTLLAAALKPPKASPEQVFGGGKPRATFEDLYLANGDALGRAFPHDQGLNEWDGNRADMALATRLAFWTGKDCERIERLMRTSALMRDKWDRRPKYLRDTILKACALCGPTQGEGRPPAPPQPATPAGPPPPPPALSGALATRVGDQYLTATLQTDYFRGCVYVQSIHRALTPDGSLLEPKQFKATYGGYKFCLDPLNDKQTRNAWEAFTESQAIDFPKVNGMTFQPAEPFGAISRQLGRTYVNTFIPQYGARQPGPVDPFLDHLARLVPDAGDREILLSYMAACVQRPGVKFQWCPMVQGVPGNGKTILYHILEYALGQEYCHQLDPGDIDTKFNAWIERKLLVTVEEIRTGGKYEVADRLKPLITNRRVPVQGKGADQRTGDNCANFLLFSNHKDGVLKSKSDRRYSIFYTAQQTAEDLADHGMNAAYFDALFDWLNGPGYAAVADHLATRAISVNMQSRAPDTTSTQEANTASLSIAEQLITDAIDMDAIGFRGDLLCTQAVWDLLVSHGRKTGPQHIVTILTELGYIKHPALAAKSGKISIQGVRRRLYVKRGSLAASIADSKRLRVAWIDLQAATAGKCPTPAKSVGHIQPPEISK